MTMPWLMNCAHTGDGWCLACVKTLGEEALSLRDTVAKHPLAITQAIASFCTSLEGRYKAPIEEPQILPDWLLRARENKAIVAKLPTTADGVPVVPGMTVYARYRDVWGDTLTVPAANHAVVDTVAQYGPNDARFSFPMVGYLPLTECYSTKAAAEQARAEAGEGDDKT